MFGKTSIGAFLLAGLLAGGPAFAGTPSIKLLIQNQRFSPEEIAVPANAKVELVVINQGSLPAEFESFDLSREVVVPGGSTVKVYIGPLAPGRYNFFNDFHREAQGWVVVTAAPDAAG